MLRHYLVVAFRNIFRNKVFSLITTLGLSIGMATSVLIALWIVDELNFDRFHKNIDRIFCIIERQDYSDGQVLHTNNTPFALKEELLTNFPEVANATRTLRLGDRPIGYEDEVFTLGPVVFVDPEFLEIFTFEQIKGNPNALSEPNTILITEEIAQTFFNEVDPIGKTLQMDGQFDFEVGGVLKDVPANSTFQFSILIPFVQLENIYDTNLNSWGNNWPRSTVLLKNDAPPAEFQKKIEDLCKEHGQENTTLFLKPMINDHLYSNSGDNNRVQYVYLFMAIGIIILLIASMNFVNLSTAKSEERAIEVGVRKVVGANRWNLINQFFSEKVILVFISLTISIILAALLMPLFNDISGKKLEFNPIGNPGIILLFLGVGFLSAILSGIYPSLILSSFSPVRALKKMHIPIHQKRFSLRSALVIVQFALSIILIVNVIVVLSQLNYIKNFNLGYKAENLVYVDLPGQTRKFHESFSNEIRQIPGITNLTKADKPPFWGGNSSWGYDWEGKDPELKVLICQMRVDRNYFDVLDIPFRIGGTFPYRFTNNNEEPIKDFEVILNVEAIRRMNMEEPIGKFFGRGEYKGTIIGVTEDFHFESLKRVVEPLLLIPLQEDPNVIIARIQKDDIHASIEAIEKAWKKINPSAPFSFGFFDNRLEQMYRSEARISKLFRYFTAIALFIASLGLLGLSSFSIQRRTKEIGVRKVVGAPVGGIVVLLTKDFVRWVFLAFIIACPIAWYSMNQWLQNFAYKTDISWWFFVLSGMIALLVALVTVSFQTVKASLRNPVDSLRYE